MRFLYNIYLHVTALFKYLRILKFKSQLTLAFFTAVSQSSQQTSWETELYLKGFKESKVCDLCHGGFQSDLCVSVFQGSLLVIVIMIDSSEECHCEGGF